jgi:hypothetical protein
MSRKPVLFALPNKRCHPDCPDEGSERKPGVFWRPGAERSLFDCRSLARLGRALAALFLLAPALFTPSARAQSRPAPQQNATTAGEFLVDPPTLVSLGFEWRIAGDDNRNARVEVTFRKRGDQEWRPALPLLRLQREQVSGGTPREGSGHYFTYVAPNMFAGSILNLDPDTEYECRFVLTDPDGVRGTAHRVVSVRTRKEPTPAEGGHVYHVYPFGYKGAKQEPSFTGILAAYYLGSDQSDHSNAFPPRVQPGDIILVHAGVYKDNRFVYSGFDRTIAAYGTPFDGTYYLTASGTSEKPIVIKGAGDGEVVFDGDGCQNLFNLMGGTTAISRASPSATRTSRSCSASRISPAPADSR